MARRVRIMDEVLAGVRHELIEAFKEHGDFASAHEGYAVIREELELELWPEVGKKRKLRSTEVLLKESIQIAAMAVKFAVNIDRMVG